MDYDFGLLVTEPDGEGALLWEQILIRFEDPDFILTLIHLLEEDPFRDDPFLSGLLSSIKSLICLKFGPPTSSAVEFVEDLALRLLKLLFCLHPKHQLILQDAFRWLIRSEWSLQQSAAFCGVVLDGNRDQFCIASTAVCFLKNYLRFSQYVICGEDLITFTSLILAVTTAQAAQPPDIDFPMFLRFISHCCRCLASLLVLAEDSDVGLIGKVDHAILLNCWIWGLQAIENHVDDDAVEMVKPKRRILKAFFVSRRSLFPLLDFTCLVDFSFQMLSSTTSPFLTDSLLILLHSIMESDLTARHLVLTSLDARVLFAAARLSSDDLAEFQNVPVRYMDCCLLFSQEKISHSPRTALLQIAQSMSCEEVVATAQRIEELEFLSEPADLEILFFLMHCIALTGKHPLPERYICTAEVLLSFDPHPVLAATLLMCLSGVDAKKERRLRFLATAWRYIESGPMVVQHSALMLCCRNFDIVIWEVDFVWELTSRVFPLVTDNGHPQLLPILINLLRFLSDAASSLDPTPTMIDWFNEWAWPVWWNSEREDSSAYIGVLEVFLRLLPEQVVWNVASFLGQWFCTPDTTLPLGDVMSVALMVARNSPDFPEEFFNVLPFCMKLLDVDNAWIAPASEMCALLVQYPRCGQVPEALSRMDHIRRDVLERGLSELGPPESVPRMLILSACFVQARGRNVLPLVLEAMPFFLKSAPLTPVWSAALVVILSGIIVSFFVPGSLGELLTLADLRSWYEFGEWIPDGDEHLPFNRLSVMSIAGFLVVAMALSDAAAFSRAIHQMATLTCDTPDVDTESWERLCLPFDAIDIVVLLANFRLDYEGECMELAAGDDDRASFMKPRTALEAPGFREYLSHFNHWLRHPENLDPE
jgi:hypothetical protein